MHLKLLGDTAGVVISFFSHLQSKGQTIPKAISSPVILARHLQQKAVSNQVLSHLMYTKARHQTEQPACKLLLSPIMSCSQSEQKNAVCFSTCQWSYGLHGSSCKEQHSAFCLVIEWENNNNNNNRGKNRGSFSPRGWWCTEQVAQGGCGCPIPAGIQGQAGCGSGQPGLLVGNAAHSRGLEPDDHCGPFQPRPFYDSMILLLIFFKALSIF